MSDELGERFHQDFKSFQQNNQGFWDRNMLGDYFSKISYLKIKIFK